MASVTSTAGLRESPSQPFRRLARIAVGLLLCAMLGLAACTDRGVHQDPAEILGSTSRGDLGHRSARRSAADQGVASADSHGSTRLIDGSESSDEVAGQRAALSDRLGNLDGDPRLAVWPRKIELAMDRSLLDGISLPADTAIYLLRIVEGVEGPAFIPHEAGLGAFSEGYWPASAIKVLAAIAALERILVDYDFNGDAVIRYGLGGLFDGQSLRAAYLPAINVSSNEGYSRTLQVAGGDWINERFFTARRGLGNAILQRTYVRGDAYSAVNRPEITVELGGRREVEPARTVPLLPPPAGCATDGQTGTTQNCVSLYHMVEGLRRLVLDAEVQAFERFVLDPADITALTDALCTPHSGNYLGDGAAPVGGTRRYCNKTGVVPGYHCLDHALIETGDGQRLLLAAATPYEGSCSGKLSPIAERVFAQLGATTVGRPIQQDAGNLEVSWQADAGGTRLDVWADVGDRLEIWIDDERIEMGGTTLSTVRPLPMGQDTLVIARALAGARPVAYRAVVLRPEGGPGCVAAGPDRPCTVGGGDGGIPGIPDGGAPTDAPIADGTTGPPPGSAGGTAGVGRTGRLSGGCAVALPATPAASTAARIAAGWLFALGVSRRRRRQRR